ncbi:PIN domain-containing protein [Shewanella sp. 1_MG-2023]|uniref:PIN domain-containing protein n=1 Tax=unclassified Shewanella TaxID=196818 RepID=UPI0026E49245|nr:MULTISPECIES: PIN domain-containing protein [unclassified Shewanella]MDO6611624.1 PIN domain-containing protein [Shewanella sp. 7_MG-2023]MDO6771479.1 PIN domain-containing protein [Shewanella sp. 2_MG-2023]MDO6793872.1 PIN domain-containing protein [Shewanella sp. 1_MG-2023]
METRNVFIDTQAIMRQGFKFENRVLSKLSRLGEAGKLNILISEVVQNEVTSKITEKLALIEKSKSEIEKAISIIEGYIPKEIDEAIAALDTQSLTELAIARWDKYISDSNISVIDPNDICNSELLSLYFDGSFPFSEGKKKDEFPDAISLLSLKVWTDDERESVYVISDDKDLKGFCASYDSFISVDKLTEFLDIYNRAEERLTTIVHSYVEKATDWVRESIREAYIECYFDYSDNWKAEVQNVKVTHDEIFEINVVEIDKESATLSLKVRIKCTADVSGPDYDNSIWDGEDKEYIFVETFSQNMEFDEFYDISMKVEFNEEDKELTEICDILIDEGSSITLQYDDGYPYK